VIIRKAGYEDEPGLLAFIESVDYSFNPPLSTRVDLGPWLKKVLKMGVVLVSVEQTNIEGVIAFYCNDRESRQAFITFLGVAKSARRQGIGRGLLEEAILVCRRKGMKSVLLTTGSGNEASIPLYRELGFKEEEDRESRQPGRISLRLSLDDCR
jgi:ribosomal protein S18 acetylase RimI-like enzyme